MGRELQRTYRGRAWREEDPDGKRGLHEVDRAEHAVLIASMGCSPVEEADRLTEMAELLRTAGATVVHRVVQHRDRPDPRLYLGRGRLDEVVEWV